MNLVKNSVKCLLLAALVAPVISFAEAEDKSDRAFRDGQKIFRQLNLSEDQKSKLKAMRSANKDTNRAKRKEIKAKLKDIRMKMKAGGVSTDELKSLHSQKKSLKNEMMDLRFSRMLALKEILTAEQFQKFQELRKDRKEERRKNKMSGGKGY